MLEECLKKWLISWLIWTEYLLKYFFRTESIKSFPLFQADENLADVKVEKKSLQKINENEQPKWSNSKRRKQQETANYGKFIA